MNSGVLIALAVATLQPVVELKPPLLVVIHTEAGEIHVALEPNLAPRTVANFLAYVEAGAYDGASFYRTVRSGNQPDNPVKIAVIQGGLGDAPRTRDPIPLERTSATGLRHVDGAISMARAAPDSATSEFFICVGDQPELDEGGRRNPDGQGFAAFGRVLLGMDIVRRIHQAPAEAQRLTPPVRITRVERRDVGVTPAPVR